MSRPSIAGLLRLTAVEERLSTIVRASNQLETFHSARAMSMSCPEVRVRRGVALLG